MPCLSPEEVAQAQLIVNKSPKGEYELKELYGEKWTDVDAPNKFGKRFKNAIEKGRLKNIRVGRLKSNNHRCYEIY